MRPRPRRSRPFSSRTAQSPLREEASFRLAQTHYRREQFEKAAGLYADVAKGKGEFAEAAGFEQGLALYKAGKLKDAAAAFAGLAERFPQGAKSETARLYAGTFLYEAGDYAGAAERLKPLAAAKQGEAARGGLLGRDGAAEGRQIRRSGRGV